MSLSRFHSFGIKLIDLLILACALLLISSSAVGSGDLELLSLDFMQLSLVVIIVYGVSVLIVGILCLSISSDTWFSRMSKSAISGLLLFLMFPWLVSLAMFFLGYHLTADAQTILIAVALIRGVVRAFLGRQWSEVA